MAVKLVPKFNAKDITAIIQQKKRNIEEAMLLRLKFVGEQFVRNARNNADFTDRTGNLRSSMGYVIIKNGQQLVENFEQRAGGPEGVDVAKKAIDEAKAKFPTGFVLIGVAGMEYAAAVESLGYDVISASAVIAEASLKLALQKLASKIGA